MNQIIAFSSRDSRAAAVWFSPFFFLKEVSAALKLPVALAPGLFMLRLTLLGLTNVQ